MEKNEEEQNKKKLLKNRSFVVWVSVSSKRMARKVFAFSFVFLFLCISFARFSRLFFTLLGQKQNHAEIF